MAMSEIYEKEKPAINQYIKGYEHKIQLDFVVSCAFFEHFVYFFR